MQINFEIPDIETKEIQEAVDNFKTDGEVEKLNAVCFWLVKMCAETNATVATITQENVHQFGKALGTWEIKITKKAPSNTRE